MASAETILDTAQRAPADVDVRATKTRRLPRRFASVDQVQEIVVYVAEECEAVSLRLVWLAFERHTLLAKLLDAPVEIVDRDGDVAHAGGANASCGRVTFGGDDFDQRAVLCFDKVIACVLERDFEVEISDVPVRKPFRIGRGDREVFNAGKHQKA